MPQPKISILIPTYNRVAYLEKAIESARAQRYPNLEIVVSDNASTDDTPRLEAKYRDDSRIRWSRNAENLGLAGNWRKLLYELAQGEYVKILADDDYLDNPDHIRIAADLIVQHHVNVVFSGAGSYDERFGSVVDRSWDIPSVLSPEWWMEHIGDRKDGKTLFPNLTTNGVFHLAKARALNAFVDPVFGMDYQLGCELMLSGPSGYLTGIHGIERKHPDNDGLNATLDVVMTSLKLYDRVRGYGATLGHPEASLRSFALKIMNVMVRGFVLYSWGAQRGTSLRSFRELDRTLRAIDPLLPRQSLWTPGSLVRFFFGSSPRGQEFLRRLYYRIHQWRGTSSQSKRA